MEIDSVCFSCCPHVSWIHFLMQSGTTTSEYLKKLDEALEVGQLSLNSFFNVIVYQLPLLFLT